MADKRMGSGDIGKVAGTGAALFYVLPTGFMPILPTYTVATAPDAASYDAGLIYVSNGAAGSPIVAYSNGTNWLRVDTAAAIAAA